MAIHSCWERRHQQGGQRHGGPPLYTSSTEYMRLVEEVRACVALLSSCMEDMTCSCDWLVMAVHPGNAQHMYACMHTRVVRGLTVEIFALCKSYPFSQDRFCRPVQAHTVMKTQLHPSIVNRLCLETYNEADYSLILIRLTEGIKGTWKASGQSRR